MLCNCHGIRNCHEIRLLLCHFSSILTHVSISTSPCRNEVYCTRGRPYSPMSRLKLSFDILLGWSLIFTCLCSEIKYKLFTHRIVGFMPSCFTFVVMTHCEANKDLPFWPDRREYFVYSTRINITCCQSRWYFCLHHTNPLSFAQLLCKHRGSELL